MIVGMYNLGWTPCTVLESTVRMVIPLDEKNDFFFSKYVTFIMIFKVIMGNLRFFLFSKRFSILGCLFSLSALILSPWKPQLWSKKMHSKYLVQNHWGSCQFRKWGYKKNKQKCLELVRTHAATTFSSMCSPTRRVLFDNSCVMHVAKQHAGTPRSTAKNKEKRVVWKNRFFATGGTAMSGTTPEKQYHGTCPAQGPVFLARFGSKIFGSCGTTPNDLFVAGNFVEECRCSWRMPCTWCWLECGRIFNLFFRKIWDFNVRMEELCCKSHAIPQ